MGYSGHIQDVSGNQVDFTFTENLTITGGSGADQFYFNVGLFGNDVVTDFENGVDKIRITNQPGIDDISDLVIDVAVPDNLPRLRGRVTGAAAARLQSMHVEVSGPIIGKLQSAVRADGSFEIQDLTPGGYWVRIYRASAY